MNSKEIRKLSKYRIEKRTNGSTRGNIQEENFEMIRRIGNEVFHLYERSWTFDKDSECCFPYAGWQAKKIRIKDNMKESVFDFERDLSEYEIIILKEVITTFYGVTKEWCEDLLGFGDDSIKSMMEYFWDALHYMEYILDGRIEIIENPFDFNNGRERMKNFGKHKKNSRKDFKRNFLIPLRSGEVQHHLTNNIIIGIPEEVHKRLSGYDRETHREKVLEWLDEQAEKAKIAHAYLALDEMN